MKQDIENIIKKWLKEHKDGGQYVGDYDGEFDLDSCCLDGDFDLNDLADEVLKIVVEIYDESVKIAEKKWTEDVLKNGSSVNPLNYIRRELLSNLEDK